MNPPAPDLARLLHPFGPGALDRYPDSAFVCDLEGTLLHVNAGWRIFASENGGEPAISARWSTGANLFSAIPGPLQAFYRRLFAVAAAGRPASMGPVDHVYECSSPTKLRRFHMTLYALPEQRGLLVVNARVVDRPHDPVTHPPVPPGDEHVDANGMAHQCAHCRRVSNLLHPGRWDWVPDWVARCPPGTSHTLCEPCFAAYYAPLP